MSSRRVGVLVGAALVLGAALFWWFRTRTSKPTAKVASEAGEVALEAPSPRDVAAEGARSRAARDAMRARIQDALRRRGETVRPDPPARPAARKAAPPTNADAKGTYEPDYIRKTFREDMFPLLRSCYEGALKRKPELAGKLVLNFTIVADGDVGGVIEDADVDEESSLEDRDMETCVRESLMTLTFDKPPKGGGYVTVKYPVAFAPGPDEEGDARADGGA